MSGLWKRDDNIINFINDEITDMQLSFNSKLANFNQKFNLRLEFYKIRNNIDDFIDNRSYNRFFVLSVFEVLEKQLFYIMFMIIYKIILPSKEMHSLNDNTFFMSFTTSINVVSQLTKIRFNSG